MQKNTKSISRFPENQEIEAQYFLSFGHPNPSLRLSDDFTKNYSF